MSELQINCIGWLIILCAISIITGTNLAEWFYKRQLYRIAIDRRLYGISKDHEVVWAGRGY